MTGVDVEADTTFALMLAAQERGHQVLYVDPRDVGVAGGQSRGPGPPGPTPARGRTTRPSWARRRTVALDDEVDVVFQRTDPPVDAAYTTVTQLLGLCRRARVLNRPAGILAANEKLYALHFADLMPATRVTPSIQELLEFMEEMGGEMIVKPLDGKGGEGVFHVHRDDRNLFSILEQSTRFGREWAMAQRYLPAVRQGDKRILLVDGEPLGAVLRVPAETRGPGQSPRRRGRAEKAAVDAGRPAHHRTPASLARARRSLLRGDRRHRGPPHRGERDQPHRDPGDEPARRCGLPGPGDRAGGGPGLATP